MSNVARRKLNFQQLENALGTSLPAVIKGHAILRDAKLTESSYDKVVMWTSGSYDCDDVISKIVPTCFTDPEADASTIVPGSQIWTQPSMDRPHWNEILDALQEDVDFCEDGETTIARDGAIAIPVVFYITDDSQEAIGTTDIIASSTSFPTPWVPGHARGSQCCTEVSSVPDEVQVSEIRDRA